MKIALLTYFAQETISMDHFERKEGSQLHEVIDFFYRIFQVREFKLKNNILIGKYKF